MGLRATNSPQSRPIMPGMKRFAVLLVAIVVPLSLAVQPRLQTYSHPTCRYSLKEVSLECERQRPGGGFCSRDMAFLTNGRQWISFDAAAHSGSLELALKSAMITPPPLATYTHPTCGYSFRHLEDSTVTPADEQG